MNIHGWGRFPVVDAEISRISRESVALDLLHGTAGLALTPRGLGRSYGDSSLGAHVVDCSQLDRYIDFEPDRGILECEAGTSLHDIIRRFLPMGWFPPVTPGTQFVTVGGAIASDVHGKNHHGEGSFSEHVESFRILTGLGEILQCSSHEHPDLFQATCGGMGLTGIILSARLRLRRVQTSEIECLSIRAQGLGHLLELFEQHSGSTYSVAWIDCLKGGAELGRGVLMLGEHAEHGPLQVAGDAGISIPNAFPGAALNNFSIRAFNALYYHRSPKTNSRHRMSYRPYFYPLDSLMHWNRLYGHSGFVQYQFMIPKSAGARRLRSILERIADIECVGREGRARDKTTRLTPCVSSKEGAGADAEEQGDRVGACTPLARATASRSSQVQQAQN